MAFKKLSEIFRKTVDGAKKAVQPSAALKERFRVAANGFRKGLRPCAAGTGVLATGAGLVVAAGTAATVVGGVMVAGGVALIVLSEM